MHEIQVRFDMGYDVLIKGAQIIDGTGSPWFWADVGVKSERISRIGRITETTADKEIDAEGLICSPGFVDIHSHSDFTLLLNPDADSKVRQGVTTEMNGTCGLSAAPIAMEKYEEYQLAASLVGFTCALMREINPDWTTMKEYLNKLERQGTPVNFGTYIGHTNLRLAAMGLENRPCTNAELREMKQLLDEEMKSGAFGLSTALSHIPARFAETREIIELCKVVARFGGHYAEHGRVGGSRILETTREAISIGKSSGVPVILSHHTPPTDIWEEDLRLISKAREEGVDLIRDIIVFAYGSGGPHLLLPYWVVKDGFKETAVKLRNPEIRRKLTEEIPASRVEAINDSYVIVAEKTPEYMGKTWSEIAEERGTPVIEAVFDLLAINEILVKVVNFGNRSDDAVIASLKDPLAIPETDAGSLAPEGIIKNRGDARGYGTFPLLLGEYVREKKTLTWEEAIRRITSYPAQRLKLMDRGMLREGMKADITVFNPKTIIHKATPTKPNQYPVGVEHVLVNGVLTVEDGEYTGKRAGKILRHRP